MVKGHNAHVFGLSLVNIRWLRYACSMNFLDIARLRHSLRKYAPDRTIPREALERCLEAARLAPSACNSQPWSFVIVETPAAVRALTEQACSGLYKMNHFVANASALVVVTTEKMKLAARLGAQFRGVQYSLIDIGIACEHLILQAAEDGIGSCWLGWFNERAVKKALGLPRSTSVDLMISLGYPDGEPTHTLNRKPLDEIRRYTQTLRS